MRGDGEHLLEHRSHGNHDHAGVWPAVPYRPEQAYVDIDRYYEIWNATRNRLQDAFGHEIHMEIEPGRYLVAESGFLVAEIRAVKQMGQNTFYLLDAGFNDLARPILYGSHHPFRFVVAMAIRRFPSIRWWSVVHCVSRAISSRKKKVALWLAAICRARTLVITWFGSGWCLRFVMASNYNSKFRPAEVLIEGGVPNLCVAVKRSMILLGPEMIPS